MNSKPQGYWKRFCHRWLGGAMLFAAGTISSAHAQSTLPAPSKSGATLPNVQSMPLTATSQEAVPAPDLKEGLPPPTVAAPVSAAAGCASCGGCDGQCVPGRFEDCCGCNSTTVFGRILGGVYQELCCPDACYQGKWIPVANAAFFVEGTRPVTTTRFRWEYANNFTLPDRSEFFWAKSGGNGGKGPKQVETRLNYSQLSMYQEIATGGFSAFIDLPYLAVDPLVNPYAAGFGDMKIGTKSLVFDRDLFQLGFMMQTTIPMGNFTVGLGTGHVSLEPTLLSAVKLTPDTYLQTQLSEWIPLGGDPDYMGSILHYHFSLNHVLYRPVHNVELIGTAEFTGYSFQAGQFTDPVLGQGQRLQRHRLHQPWPRPSAGCLHLA